MNNIGELLQAISIGVLVVVFLLNTRQVLKAIELCRECILLLEGNPGIKGEKLGERLYEKICLIMVNASILISDHRNAIKYAEKPFQICFDIGERLDECQLSIKLAKMYFSQSKYLKVKDLYEKALQISIDISCRDLEACCYRGLGTVFEAVSEYEKAREHLEKSLVIHKEIGDRNGEASCYGNLGSVYRSTGEYEKARENLEKSLAIHKEIGDRNGEAFCYGNLGSVYRSTSEYEKAREHLEKSLAIHKEIGERNAEATCYGILGNVYRSVGEYEKAREHVEKSLVIHQEIGDRNGEATCYGILGNVYRSVGEYVKAREHLEKSLAIHKESGGRNGEASCYENLGSVYMLVGECEKSTEHLHKSLVIRKEICDRNGEAYCYESLGKVYESVGAYEKAREHLEKSLTIQKEIGDRNGEASCHGNLGSVCHCVGEFKKAIEHVGKSLAIYKTIGDRNGEAFCYQSLGNVAFALRNYRKAYQHYEKSLAITTDIGARRGVAISFVSQGKVLFSFGDAAKAKKYFERALSINQEIGNREGESDNYLRLGCVYHDLEAYETAEKYLKKGLEISVEIGDVEKQFQSLIRLALVRLKEGKIPEAIRYLLTSIEKCEDLRSSLRNNDQFKISFSDKNILPYRYLSVVLCKRGNPNLALYALELVKARALADLMSAQYSTQIGISADRQTWTSIERIVEKVCNCTCLYVSYCGNSIYLWILKGREVRRFRMINLNKFIAYKKIRKDLKRFLNRRTYDILPGELLKDVFEQESESYEEHIHLGPQILGQERQGNRGPKMNLALFHKLILTPVADLLEGPEIVIVPDLALYNVPFAALPDEKGECFSENYWVRLAPSLTTLKLIHDSPPYYHCQTGVLIVGNPDVGTVIWKSREVTISPLPYAEKEANMVGKKLGVQPLIGQHATKQAFLQAMKSVALIHISAHGDAERGEIVLAPTFRTPNRLPREVDFLLTMSDISKVKMRAKLVVLSCCHSGCGEIKAEGVVGMARAFLGSGARSVLVGIWAIEDEEAMLLMSRFYDHLVDGKSASESLHEAMKWMRCNGFSDVSQWAPFVLIGDNVTFQFKKKGGSHCEKYFYLFSITSVPGIKYSFFVLTPCVNVDQSKFIYLQKRSGVCIWCFDFNLLFFLCLRIPGI